MKKIKTITNILGVTVSLIILAMLLSCMDNISLGKRIDIEGPIISITAPNSREPVVLDFTVSGTAKDYTGVEELLVKLVLNNQEIKNQWRYKSEKWQTSSDFGNSWADYNDATWTGTYEDALWSVDIKLPPQGTSDGEYTIVVQAWDKAGFSTDKSYATRVVILDQDPPKVNITLPFLYVDPSQADKKPIQGDGDFYDLDRYSETESVNTGYGYTARPWEDPTNLGKFITRGFKLQYQIDDQFDIRSIQINFYDAAFVTASDIDQDPNTSLPLGEIFKYEVVSAGGIKPSGTVDITLSDMASVTTKTTIMVVAHCYDASKNVNGLEEGSQEKILGYFVYWPMADNPWIAFTEGMKETYANANDVYMVYPGRDIKATAYANHGVKSVTYTVKKYQYYDYTGNEDLIVPPTKITFPERFGGVHSSTESWSFKPPSSSGYYGVAVSVEGVDVETTDRFKVMFFVQDVSYPDFPVQPSPSASSPLFEFIGKPEKPLAANPGTNKIRISGTVSDATKISHVSLVWINPQSKGYAAMSQLQYFRDSEYIGWKNAENISEGTFIEEDEYDKTNKNKVWKVSLTEVGKDNATERIVYNYSQVIDISDHLNIAGTPFNQPLRSQVFLLKATNPDKKSTIITYAPQGDESSPKITINNVIIKRSGKLDVTLSPGTNDPLDAFESEDQIIINGGWVENSIQYLPFESYLKNNFKVTINGIGVTPNSFNPNSGTVAPDTNGDVKGTWQASVTVGGNGSPITKDNIKDTLVVAASVSDIGGNISETMGAWLIKSDRIRLLRISSSYANQKYNASIPADNNAAPAIPANTVRIFLEFNRPVALTYSGTNPTLLLNVDGNQAEAKYVINPKQSAQQYFDYKVEAGHNTNLNPVEALDVIGLKNITPGDNNHWTVNNYPFTWHSGTPGNTDYEEIRITMAAANNVSHAGAEQFSTDGLSGVRYLKRLPLWSHQETVNQGTPSVPVITPERPFSLRSGKNIEIDTKAPTVSSMKATNTGYFAEGQLVNIEVTFSENVRVVTADPQLSTTPQLQLQLYNKNANTTRPVTTTSAPKVNGDTITFTYTVIDGDTTRGNLLRVTGFSPAGSITDIAGNQLAPFTTGTGYNIADTYIEANKPNVPTIRILHTDNNADSSVITNNVNTANVEAISTVTTENTAGAAKNLAKVYNNSVFIRIDGNRRINANNSPTNPATGDLADYKLTDLEYSVDNGVNWIRVSRPSGGWSAANNIIRIPLLLQGDYKVVARQIDAAGNISNNTSAINFDWDKGTLISRIDSTSANGTYTNSGTSGRQDSINITLWFRTPITTTGNSEITLSATPATITVPSGPVTNATTMSFKYDVGTNHTTSVSNVLQNLDVTKVEVHSSATTSSVIGGTTYNTRVSEYINNFTDGLAPTDERRLSFRKSIKVDTAALALAGTPNPTYVAAGTILADDAWSGTISLRFNRAILKGSGNIVIEQSTTGYRLPAVLTEAQAKKYMGVAGFSTYYSRGVNGFKPNATAAATGSPDTSTKYILNYAESTVVTPNGSGSGIAKLAYDFMQLERVEIPITSQDISIVTGTVTNDTLKINLTGSNALPVLGATYTITIDQNFVQDQLAFKWPTAAAGQTYTRTMEGINKPYIRIDKKVNRDRITAAAGNANGTPQMSADFSSLMTTTARLDCRTPNSNVHYNAGWNVHSFAALDADGHHSNASTGAILPDNSSPGVWRSRSTEENSIISLPVTGTQGTTILPRPTMDADQADGGNSGNATRGTSGRITYNVFTGTNAPTDGKGPHITIGTTNADGYTWRVAARSRIAITGETGNRNSELSEEVAFKTVFSYELDNVHGTNMSNMNIGMAPAVGETLWIRGGDALSSSSVPGFPLTWTDNYATHNANKTRAGVRAMQRVGGIGTNSSNVYSIWRWITWEVNVETWHDVILSENFGTGTPSTADLNEAWQYGPRIWRYPRGGWVASKNLYTIFPGKHRRVRVLGGVGYEPGGGVNWTNQINVREQPAATLTMPTS